MAGRQDIHSPARFVPSDYRVIDYLDGKAPNYGDIFLAWSHDVGAEKASELVAQIRAAYEARIFEHFPDWRTGGEDHTSIHQCNHCGAHIRWIVVVEHIPTGKKLAIGNDCADNKLDLDYDAYRAKYIQTKASREAAILANKLEKAKFIEDNADVIDFLTNYTGNFDFALSLKDQLANRGLLSEKQVDAARRLAAKEAEFQAKRAARRAAETADAADFPTGRATVTGEVVSVKLKESQFGDSFKWLVKTDDGNKVWGTIPTSVLEAARWARYDERFNEGELYCYQQHLVGKTVKFTATFEVSADDNHFGFYKRPSNPEVLAA